jgi:arylsulfatase A
MVGEVMRTLDELKLRDNTLIILSSDNGGMLNQGGQDAWKSGHRLNGDLLGFKFDSWEGGHRVPFIARSPGQIPANSVSNQLICQIDFLATFAALTGSKATGPDSMNVLSTLIGPPTKPLREQLVIAPSNQKNLALREGRWLYIGAQGGGGFNGKKPGDHSLGGPGALKFTGETTSDITNGKIKPDAPAAQLYDLEVDRAQSRNIIREHPEQAALMAKHLAEFQK